MLNIRNVIFCIATGTEEIIMRFFIHSSIYLSGIPAINEQNSIVSEMKTLNLDSIYCYCVTLVQPLEEGLIS